MLNPAMQTPAAAPCKWAARSLCVLFCGGRIALATPDLLTIRDHLGMMVRCEDTGREQFPNSEVPPTGMGSLCKPIGLLMIDCTVQKQRNKAQQILRHIAANRGTNCR
jgi:hypothetical protein